MSMPAMPGTPPAETAPAAVEVTAPNVADADDLVPALEPPICGPGAAIPGYQEMAAGPPAAPAAVSDAAPEMSMPAMPGTPPAEAAPAEGAAV
jgi:hypothetical protein